MSNGWFVAVATLIDILGTIFIVHFKLEVQLYFIVKIISCVIQH